MPSTAPSDALLRLELPDQEATVQLATVLGLIAASGDVIGLCGDLGTGKTAFSRAFVNSFADRSGLPAIDVPSPTFTLVQSYEIGPIAIHHFDLYRLENAYEVIELGFEDALASGIVLIEWPELLGPLLPARALQITFQQGPVQSARYAAIEISATWLDRIGGRLDRWRA